MPRRCGPNPRDGFDGVDQYAFGGKVKHVMDVRKTPWPWKDNSVDEIHCSHFLEHLTAMERCAFVNESARVLIPGGKVTLIVPHWCSNRAYGDPTHQWPAVSEMWLYYLNREWRMANAPHTDASINKWGFSCNWEFTATYSMSQPVAARNQEFQQFALANYKEAAQDMIATLTNRKA